MNAFEHFSGNDVVIVKNGRRICGTGGALANAPIVQNKAYFEVKLQSTGKRGTFCRFKSSWAEASQFCIHVFCNVERLPVLLAVYCFIHRRLRHRFSHAAMQSSRSTTRWRHRELGVATGRGTVSQWRGEGTVTAGSTRRRHYCEHLRS